MGAWGGKRQRSRSGVGGALSMRSQSYSRSCLERFTREEPFRRVHDSVFRVHALEREPVDRVL
jgi:hypothetical protein